MAMQVPPRHSGNVVVMVPGVTLQNMVKGNLILDKGIGEGM